MTSDLETARRDFWAYFGTRDPDVAVGAQQHTNVWHPMTADGLVIMTFGITQETGSTVFLRGKLHADRDTAGLILAPHAARLSKALIVPFEAEGDAGHGRYLRKRAKETFTLKRNWPEIARWFTACRLRYAKVVTDCLDGTA